MTDQRVARGDWQTPPLLARRVLRWVMRSGEVPASIVEPTCGRGALLEAAITAFPGAAALGMDVDEGHLAAAREHLASHAPRVVLERLDAFSVDWPSRLQASAEPILVIGNPPWVTTDALGRRDATNRPPRANAGRLPGLSARTGAGTFDVAEWLLEQWVEALLGRRFRLVMLCKASVARRLLLTAARRDWPIRGDVVMLDARREFGVTVSAVLADLRPAEAAEPRWTLHDSLDDAPADRSGGQRHWGVVHGEVVADAAAEIATRHLAGASPRQWRSGLKHDCARVMELTSTPRGLVNGAGEPVDVEQTHRYPLLKGTAVARGRLDEAREVLVPQHRLGEPTARLEAAAPRLHSYLQAHRRELDARRSAIYRGQPPFAVFGVGPYTFAPWKVAVSGLHPDPHFRLVGPRDGRPVVFDDTVYFLPFDDPDEARRWAAALATAEVRAFIAARTFPGDKRPVKKSLLQRLDPTPLLGC